MPGNIFLVGPMGAGKTTVGRQLAKTLGMEFYDCDREIENRTGVNIPTIFDIEGEQGFRIREHNMIDELTNMENIILATGGGAILNEENRRNLTTRGYVIYLKASIDQLLKRTAKDSNRPLLQTQDPKGKLLELMTIRDPFYREVADLIVETDGNSVHQVVKVIIRKMKRKQ